MDKETEIAKSLLKIEAVRFNPKEPLRFKGGIISPVYVDNRKFPYFPEEWHKVIEGFADLIQRKSLQFDVLAGIETAGIPHSAALSFFLNKPSVFVRKEPKDHGTKSRIEGGIVKGKKVLLIEDLVTAGNSSLSGVKALRDEGAEVSDCLVIISYGFDEALQAFKEANMNLHTLSTFGAVIEEAKAQGKFNKEDIEAIKDWFNDRHGWAGRHGF